jgi:ribulose-phosphate 3-epimerase
MVIVSPSILSADFRFLEAEIKKVEAAGAGMIHVDVMDGHFVPNITIGPLIVEAVRKCTKLPIEAHLMIENADRYIPDFANAGADIITIHQETSKNMIEDFELIKQNGKKPAISINPDTPIESILPILDRIDMVLIMSVNPGFGGQKFMPEVLPKIKKLKSVIKEKKLAVDIGIDGGMNLETAPKAVKAGANILIAGSAIYKADDYKAVIKKLKELK